MSLIVVGPNDKQPTHHISLSDGVNTIGLIAIKPDGTPDITALRREPYPKSTLSSGGGEGSLSTTKVPYGEVSRTEWFGGLGQLRADADRSKFLIGNSIWMLNNRAVVAAPRLYKSKIGSTAGDHPAVPVIFRIAGAHITDPYYEIAWRFTPTANITLRQLSLDFHMIPHYADGSQGSNGIEARAQIQLWSSTADGTKPLSLISDTDWAKITVPETTTTFRFYTDQNLIGGTKYWLALRRGYPSGNGYYGQKNVLWHYSGQAVTPDPTIIPFADTIDGGTTWTVRSYGTPAWEAYQDLYQRGLFFEYKHALYCAVNTASGPKIFLNGDRGVATTNAAKNNLVDTTKAWGTIKWVGAFVRIIEGPAAGEWARIASHTATTLTLDRSLTTAPTANSVYVIYFTGEFQEITGHGMTNPITHVAVSNEGVIYFAQSDKADIVRTRWINSAGVWTNSGWASETGKKADLIVFAWDQEKQSVLWRALNGAKPYVSRGTVPVWGTNVTWETEIYIGDDAPIKAILYYEGKLAIRKESSFWMVMEGVPDKLDLDLSSLYSDEHGINNMAVFSPYLLFPFQDKMQRLLGQLAENLGPPVMSQELQGEVVSFVPILGAVLVGLRTKYPVGGRGTTDMGGISRVLVWNDGGWFPFCELPRGSVLLNMQFQRMDDGRDLLWILANTGIYYIRVPRESDYTLNIPAGTLNPLENDLGNLQMMLAAAPSLAIGQFDLGNKILYKWWERITFANDGFTYAGWWDALTLDLYSIQPGPFGLMYWLPPTAAGTVAIQQKAKRLGLYFVELGAHGLFEYEGFNLSYLARVNDADMWLVPINASDYDHDLNGIQEDLTAAQKLAIIDAWSRDVVPITMRSVDSQDDNKRVILGRQPKQYRRYESTMAGDIGQSKEGFYTSLAIYEVT